MDTSIRNSRSLTVRRAIDELKERLKTIRRRGGLTKSQTKRIEVFTSAVIHAQQNDVLSKFLRKVSQEAGPQMSLLCVVALGRTAIKGMRERVRVDLPFEIKDHRSEWEDPILETLVKERSPGGNEERHQAVLGHAEIPCDQPSETFVCGITDTLGVRGGSSGMLNGYVRDLSVGNVQDILQIQDSIEHRQIWLTFPYNSHAMPFVTISISKELARGYIQAESSP